MLQVNDYVMIPQPKATMDEVTNYLYGKVVGFNHGTFIVIVDLHKPFNGVHRTTVPAYIASKMTELEYNLMTASNPCADMWHGMDISLGEWEDCVLGMYPPVINMKCDHNWIPSGRSFLTDKMWYNCKICGEKKGG